MTAACVSFAAAASGAASAVVADPTCADGFVLVDGATYAAMANNPLLIPLDTVWTIAPALLLMFATAFGMRQTRKALD